MIKNSFETSLSSEVSAPEPESVLPLPETNFIPHHESVAVLQAPKRKSRIGNFFRAAVAMGLMAGGTEAADKTQIEAKGAEKTLEERIKEAHDRVRPQEMAREAICSPWLAELGNKSLSVGKPTSRLRNGSEAIGIYKDGVNIGNVHSQSMALFTRETFLKSAIKLLDGLNIEYKKQTPESGGAEKKELDIQPGVLEKVKELGMKMTFYNKEGKRMMGLSGNMEFSDKTDGFYYEIDMDSDNDPESFAKLYVNEKGALVLAGVDKVPYYYEFAKDGKKVKIVKRM